jgi:hypothetical protein
MGELGEKNELLANERLPILVSQVRSTLSILEDLETVQRENLNATQEVCLLFLGRMKRHAFDFFAIQESRSIRLINRTALEGQMLFEWIYGKKEGREERARRYLNLRVIEFAKARNMPALKERTVPSEWDTIIFEELSKISSDELNPKEFNDLMTPGGDINHSKRFSAYLLEVGSVYAIFKAVGAELVYETVYKFHSMFEHWNPVSMPGVSLEGSTQDMFSSSKFDQATALWDFSRILLSVGQATAYTFKKPLTWQLLQTGWMQFEEKTTEWGEWP